MSDASVAAAPAAPTTPVIPRPQRPQRKAKQGALEKISGLASVAPDEHDADNDNDVRPTKRVKVSQTVQAKVFKKFSAWPEHLFNRALEWEWRPMTLASAQNNGWLREQEINQEQLCAWLPAREAVHVLHAHKDDGVKLTAKMLEQTRSRVCTD